MKLKSVIVAGLLAGVSTNLPAQIAPLADDAKAFGMRENAWSVDISPSGSKIVYLSAGSGRTTLAKVVDVATGQSKTIIGASGLETCGFASDDYLVCRYGGYTKVDGLVLGFSRLMAISSAGGEPRMLGQSRSTNDAGIRQFDGKIIDWLPESNGAVLMEREYIPEVGQQSIHAGRKKDGLGVDRIELATMKIQPVEQPRNEISGYTTDGNGNVRLISIEKEIVDSNYLSGVIRYRYREPGSSDWQDLGQSGGADGVNIHPLAVDASTNSVYLLKKLNGREALYRQALDGTRAITLVASSDRFDIDDVIRAGKGQRVIGYTLVDDKRKAVYFDQEYSKLASGLGKALPTSPIVHFAGTDHGGTKQLIFASADTHPGTFYLLDRKTKQMMEVAPVRPLLANRKLATVTSISYPAADGTSIPAYLTLPPGGTSTSLPTVILPHGGPSARDSWGFDWLAQFLAARGYAVIQPNYRGSSGYGDEFAGQNAFRDWKTAMSDISAAGKYLVGKGIADSSKMAIVGWSYGGYAALQLSSIEPSTYKAVVAIAPVTDLELWKKDAEEFTSGRLVENMVGTGPHVAEGSPLRHAAAIKAPVLLVHGDLDGNVTVSHSVKMASALKAAGNNAELLRFEGLDHQLDDSAARTQMLTKIGQLLERTIGK
ncbi:MAG: alpha/beta hydrolase family protein [Sphingomicrobium sp.]